MQARGNSIARTATKALKYAGTKTGKKEADKYCELHVNVRSAGYDLKPERMQAASIRCSGVLLLHAVQDL